MASIVHVVETELSNHPGTSVLLILFAFVAKQAAILLSVLSTTYSYAFSFLSIVSVALVILCHWRKATRETILLIKTFKQVLSKKAKEDERPKQ